MRKTVILTSLIGSFCVFGITSGFFEAAFMFVLFGIVPGNAYPLSPVTMLTIFTASLGAFLSFNVQSITRKLSSPTRRRNQTA